MTNHIVLYRTPNLHPLCEPLGFACTAEDADAAETLCEATHPGAEVVWVWTGQSTQAAYNDYYNIEDTQ